MKCQRCDRTATFHITELTGEEVQEIHLCAEHAHNYLTPQEEVETPSLAGVLAHQLKVGQTAEQLARLDQQACPVCGITFYEFRHVGRLGCPHDYDFFADELEPLLANIHGEIIHTGKRPKRGGQTADEQTQLIRLRREMNEAASQEDYERASQLRDEIRQIESRSSDDSATDEPATDES